MKFLRNLLATIVGLFIFTFLMIFLIILIASSGAGDKLVELEDNTVLHLKLNKPILEREVEDPLEGLPTFINIQDGGIGLMEFKEAIKHAAEDEKVKGILLESPNMLAGISTIGDMRNTLEEFKESGKFIYSYAEMYSEGAYFLASVSDEVFINPDFAMLEFNGLNIESIHFKGLFDKLEIEPITFSVGDYKGADEPFVRKNMSPQVKQRFEGLLSRIYGNILNEVAESRSISFDDIKRISDSSLVNLESDAIKYGLVDRLVYRDAVIETIQKRLEVESEDDINFVSYGKYRKSFRNSNSSSNRIAVIMASGTIVSGKGENNTVGSAKFAKEIKDAGDNEKIKAIIIRINSPGGSALASDVIWREIKLASEKKPVIASMSDQATSGGYYLAMACDTIVAQPNTITGSIGVFSMLFNVKDFLGNKLGITTDNVKTGYFSDIYTMTEPLSEYEINYIQKGTNKAYEAFVSKAADGRNMDIGAIEQFAAGRLWSGEEALENGLIDMLGNLDVAIRVAADKAGIEDDYKLRTYPIQKPPLEELLETLTGEYETSVLSKKLDEFYPYIKSLETLEEIKGIQARSLIDISF